jgi:hypothetical protein
MRFRTLALIGVVTLAGSFGASCGGEDAPPVQPVVAPTVGNLTEAVCDLLFRCCDRGELNYMLGPFVDNASCSERLLRATELRATLSVDLALFGGPKLEIPNLGAVARAIQDGRAQLDAAAVTACAEHIGQQSCNVPEEEPEEGGFCEPPELESDEPSACDVRKLVVGLVGRTGPCTSTGGRSLECAEGLVCRATGDLGVYGQCVRPSRVGELCMASADCADELYCSLLDGTCQAYRKLGESCMYSDRESYSPSSSTLLIQCEDGLHCDPVDDLCVRSCERGAACSDDEDCDEREDLICVMGRCDTLRGEGLACGEPGDCTDGFTCAQDPIDIETSICTSLLKSGNPCTQHTDCLSGFCDPNTELCAPQVEEGGECPTMLHAQCKDGACRSSGLGSYVCMSLLPDGSICLQGSECVSGACVAGFCRTLPLGNGQTCTSDIQCESEFCSLDEQRACESLPLALGRPCNSGAQCESGVCYGTDLTERYCSAGLSENEACGKPEQEPCAPKTLYCDTDEPTPVCKPLKETGASCTRSLECRGGCTVRFGRQMCDLAVAPGKAVCDQGDPLPPQTDSGAP